MFSRPYPFVSKCIPLEGKSSKYKENIASVRNAEGRLMAVSIPHLYLPMEALSFKCEMVIIGMNMKVLIGSEKLSQIESKSHLEN